MSNELIIEHDGDTWRVLGTGVDSGSKRLCHLASTTRFQWNSTTNPVQISDFVPIAALLEAEKQKANQEKRTPATATPPAGGVRPVPAGPKDCRIEDLQHALRLTVRAIEDLLPGAKHIPANVGLINEALITSRIVLKDKADA